MKNVRIISNGSSRGTQVIDTSTGLPLRGIKKLTVVFNEDGGATCEITQTCRVIGIDAVIKNSVVQVEAVPEDSPPAAVPVTKSTAAPWPYRQFKVGEHV